MRGGDYLAWIAVHEQIDGSKLRQLKKEIGCSKLEAVGILVELWLWGLNNADRTGEMKSADREDVAKIFACDLSKKILPHAVVDALIAVGWIDDVDGRLFIHDWAYWQEQWYQALDKREKDRKRKKDEAAKKRAEIPSDFHGIFMENLSQPSPSPESKPASNGHSSSTEKAQGKESIGATAPAHSRSSRNEAVRHKHGEYGWVRLSDEEYSRLLNDLGADELARCIAYVDESAQTTTNKNKWSDWNLIVRKCSRGRWGLDRGGAAVTRLSKAEGAMDDMRALHDMFSEEEV